MTLAAPRSEAEEVAVAPELTLGEMIARQEQLRPLVMEFNRLRKTLREAYRLSSFEPDHEYRVGAFRVKPLAIAGGGFSVPQWKSVTYIVVPIEEE
jgi:hypothetical protein